MPKNRRTLQFAGLWLCVFSCALAAMAGAAEPSGSPFVVDSWSNEEKLPQSSVISVIQTKDGYLWLGTLYGLVRFDGIHFTPFNVNNTPGLPSSRVVFLFEDSRTNLWAGTETAGLCVIKNGVVKSFAAETAGGGRKVTNAEEGSSGDIWFQTAEGLLGYHAGNVNFFPGVWRPFLGPFQKWQNEKKNFGPFPWGNTVVTAACEDENGNLIVGTLGAGVFWYDAGGKFQQVSTNQGLSSTYVLSLCLDHEGNLWAGTDGGGLNRIKRKIFNTPDEFPPRNVQSLSQDNHGGWWIASGALGVSHWNTNVMQDFHVGPLHDAWEVLVDRRQQIWAGTRDEGLYQFQTNQFVPAPGAEILGAQIFALFEDRAGQLWAGTQNGVANWDGQNWKLFTTRDGLSENTVRAIAQDADGNLWIGTESGGLDFFKDGKIASIQKSENGLPGNDITCLCAGKNGGLWVGTFDHGLALFQNEKWIHFSTASGLASDSISYVI